MLIINDERTCPVPSPHSPLHGCGAYGDRLACSNGHHVRSTAWVPAGALVCQLACAGRAEYKIILAGDPTVGNAEYVQVCRAAALDAQIGQRKIWPLDAQEITPGGYLRGARVSVQ